MTAAQAYLLVLDFDGVFTDGTVILGEGGAEHKRLAFSDLDALFSAHRRGLDIAVATGEDSRLTHELIGRLGFERARFGAKDKLAALRDLSEEAGVPLACVAFAGDGERDVEALAAAGLGIAPAGACEAARRAARVVLSARGGEGAVAAAIAIFEGWAFPSRDSTGAARPGVGGDDLAAIDAEIAEHLGVVEALRTGGTSDVAAAVDLLRRTLAGGGKLLAFGNGGSAADAQHLAAELVWRYRAERHGLPALALTTDSSVLTAVGNDRSFEQVFAQQIAALGRPGDLAVAISTSGRSANVVAAVRAARAGGLKVLALSGEDGGELAQLADVCLTVPSSVTARIQEGHGLLIHLFCELLDRRSEP